MSFPRGSVVRNHLPCKRWGFDTWVEKIPWRKQWQHTPGSLSRKSHGQRILVGYSWWGCKKVGNELPMEEQQQHGYRVSVQFSRSVVSDSMQPHVLQHTRPPCPSPIPRACSDSCLLRWWWHPTVSPSVTPFSSCLQSFPVSGSFPMNQFFPLGGQNIGASASASVLPINIQDWFH